MTHFTPTKGDLIMENMRLKRRCRHMKTVIAALAIASITLCAYVIIITYQGI